MNWRGRDHRLYQWLMTIFLLISPLSMEYYSQQSNQVRDISTIRSSMLSETLPQAPPPAESRILSAPKATNRRDQDPGVQKTKQTNVYANTTKTQVDKRFAGIPDRVYVPNVGDATVDVITGTTEAPPATARSCAASGVRPPSLRLRPS
jgi:hypothetical protein